MAFDDQLGEITLIGLDWIGLDGFEWIGLEWIGLDQMDWIGSNHTGLILADELGHPFAVKEERLPLRDEM